ncbi:MAG: MarR family transcriptional regulator [Gemmatimonadetes bacterium]|nr:MarR family transcriptional regulator [Gemmatimonadota bacterium]
MVNQQSGLARDVRQSKTFASLSEQAALGLLITADVIRRFFEGVFEGVSLTSQQYNVLRILRGAGADGLPTLEIANRMIEKRPGITRMIDRLETKGLVRRVRGSDDRRCVYCFITPDGARLIARLDEPLRRAQHEVLAMVSEKQQRKLIELLDSIRAGHDARMSG